MAKTGSWLADSAGILTARDVVRDVSGSSKGIPWDVKQPLAAGMKVGGEHTQQKQ